MKIEKIAPHIRYNNVFYLSNNRLSVASVTHMKCTSKTLSELVTVACSKMKLSR